MSGGGNDKVQQNQAAQTQIHTNTAEAQKNFADWLMSHPSILSQMPGSIAGPQQFSGSVGGGNFAGGAPPSSGPSAQPPMQGQQGDMLHRALQQRMPMGTPGIAPGQLPPGAPPTGLPGAPTYQGGPPPGLLGLLAPGRQGQ